MLGADYDGVDACGAVVLIIFDGDLALGIGTQVGHLFSFTTYSGKLFQQTMGEIEGKGHVVLGLVGGVAEHHSLVASSLILTVLLVDAAIDVAALFVYGREYATTVAVKHVFALGVAYAVDDFTGYTLEVYIGSCLDFASQDYLTCRDEGFAGHFRLGVEGEELVEYGVADLIGNFVWVSF